MLVFGLTAAGKTWLIGFVLLEYWGKTARTLGKLQGIVLTAMSSRPGRSTTCLFDLHMKIEKHIVCNK